MSNPYIKQYVTRNVNGVNQTVGVIVASVVDGKLKFGWSLAQVRPSLDKLAVSVLNRKASPIDTFDANRGEQLAVSRLNARSDSKKPLTMPQTIKKELRDKKVEVKLSQVMVNGEIPKNVVPLAGTNRGVKIVRGFENRAKKYFKIG